MIRPDTFTPDELNTTEPTMITIHFEPSGIRTKVPEGTSLLAAAQKAGLSITASCGGNSTCGKCRLRILSTSSALSPLSDAEKKVLDPEEIESGIRLACDTRCFSDTTVELFEGEKESGAVILTEDFQSNYSDTNSDCDSAENNTSVKLGLAIDIGTTTLAAYLYDLDTRKRLATTAAMNPQIPYGDDVISRIRYCQNSEQNLSQLHTLLIGKLNELIEILVQEANHHADDIFEIVLVGNTVMTHLLLGVSPESLGHSPFTPVVKSSVTLSSSEHGLKIHPEGTCYILPAADGFIGADHISVLLQTNPQQYTGTTLIIDIGTNSEICLCSDGEMYVTSCATGPALEGAMIQCGMHAASGAIDHVSIDPETLEPSLHWIGDEDALPKGICGSGIIDAAAQMTVTGILDADGSFSPHAESARIRTNAKGEKEYILYEETGIVVTQNDIRNIQLAKAALYAGVKLLLEKSGCNKPDRILLAGAFGSYIDRNNALLLGLFPDCPPEEITAVGNAAGAGAVLVLLHKEKRDEADSIADKVHFIESASDPSFPRLYADAMVLPHKKDSFPYSNPCNWSCPGKDTHFLPGDVFELDFKVLEDADELLRILPKVREYNHDSCQILPLIQNLEACVYGTVMSKQAGYWVPGAYPYASLDEVENLSFDLLSDQRIQGILKAVGGFSSRVITGDSSPSNKYPLVVEIEAPFSILTALLEPKKVFAALRRDPERVLKLLTRIADGEIKYIDHLIKHGATLLSLADPAGNTALIGEKSYKTAICQSQVYLLKKTKRYLKNGIIHLCGHMAADLIRTNAAVSHPVRLLTEATYVQSLQELTKDPKIRFMGPGCIRTGSGVSGCTGTSVIGNILELT